MSRIHEALKLAADGREPSLLEFEPRPFRPVDTAIGNAEVAEWLNLGAPVDEQAVSSTVTGLFEPDQLWQRCRKSVWKLNPACSVFSNEKFFARGGEQFRKLRSRLYEFRETAPLCTLLVTSTVPAEGKTFVALNLALAITRQHNRRVLLVDGDLRAPKLAGCLGTPATPGLSEFLRGLSDEASTIQTDAESGLFFMPAGGMVKNPTELLASDQMGRLLNRMAHLFDWIIVDAPPVLPVSDANILAGQCNGVLVVVRAESTNSDAVRTALQELRGKRVLGVVLNRAEQQESYGASAYYAEDRTEQA
jgi:capsular exopolysaccharide synthesis family protein